MAETGNAREKTVCFTGHRRLPEHQTKAITAALKAEIIALIEQGYRVFRAGGALGFDTLAAQTVLALKKEYPDIKLILDLPCVTQAEHWSEQDKRVYAQIKAAADRVVYVSRAYSKDCMFKRNRHLVDNSSVCICYLTKQRGGTAYTEKYARTSGLRVVNIAGASEEEGQ